MSDTLWYELVTMDDMFDLADLCAGDDDSMLSEFDASQEPQMRCRAYTWPTRPVVASVVDERSSTGSEASSGVVPVAGPQLLSADDGERGSRGELQLSPGGGVNSSRKVIVVLLIVILLIVVLGSFPLRPGPPTNCYVAYTVIRRKIVFICSASYAVYTVITHKIGFM